MGKFPRKVKRFICPDCQEDHDSEQAAEDCCPRDGIEPEDMWQCVDCDEVYMDREDAYSCCE